MPLKAIAINCTLKPRGESSTDVMIGLLKDAFAEKAVELTETIRIPGEGRGPGTSVRKGGLSGIVLAGRDPPDLCSKDGLLDELKKAPSERMLSAEPDDRLEISMLSAAA